MSPTHTVSPAVTDTRIPEATAELEQVRLLSKTFAPKSSAYRELIATFRSNQPLGAIQAAVYDLHGRRVAQPRMQQESQGYGLRWDGVSDAGQECPAGIYVLELSAGGSSRRIAVVLAR